MTSADCMNELMKIKGVGTKVASCVMLFSLGKRDAFPIDVWMKRIMESMYFEKETKKEEIEAFAKKLYGEDSGYAQQYLFYYGRELNIGK
jgi:N-glycosylase/DNA lyase